jgi:hypothetical protein
MLKTAPSVHHLTQTSGAHLALRSVSLPGKVRNCYIGSLEFTTVPAATCNAQAAAIVGLEGNNPELRGTEGAGVVQSRGVRIGSRLLALMMSLAGSTGKDTVL